MVEVEAGAAVVAEDRAAGAGEVAERDQPETVHLPPAARPPDRHQVGLLLVQGMSPSVRRRGRLRRPGLTLAPARRRGPMWPINHRRVLVQPQGSYKISLISPVAVQGVPAHCRLEVPPPAADNRAEPPPISCRIGQAHCLPQRQERESRRVSRLALVRVSGLVVNGLVQANVQAREIAQVSATAPERVSCRLTGISRKTVPSESTTEKGGRQIDRTGETRFETRFEINITTTGLTTISGTTIQDCTGVITPDFIPGPGPRGAPWRAG